MNPTSLPCFFAFIKGDPLLEVAGAYFPAWFACMVGGALGAWVLHEVLGRLGGGAVLRPAVVFFPCVFLALTCGLWLLFFSAR